ncbi:MAG: ATP-binding protein [Paracoccus sp. (in: a-proteobacteria)]|uniref:sensor histidine kinase n=1 Tax=Paracoccus sp. TaxID=267 RepID=UPI0039E61B10
MPDSPVPDSPGPDLPGIGPRPVWLVLAVLGALAILAACFVLMLRSSRHDLEVAQQGAARSHAQALESVLSRQRAVATVLSDDSLVRRALVSPTPENRKLVSMKLERLRDQTDSAVIYLLDRSGVGIAASNWNETQSFIGQDYSFRDYFSQALLRSEATQFALGTVSGRPGLYLSHDVTLPEPEGPETARGVIVVKVEFDALEASWGGDGGLTYVQEGSGRIILSSRPALRFGQPPPAPGQIRSSLPVPGMDWRLAVLSSAAPAYYAAALGTGTVGFVLLGLAVLAGFRLRARARIVREAEAARRYRADLERAVEQRTRALSDEMRERRAAEARLDRMQADLVQANKLAALGQITAGVAHEVNQPLATIRLLAENGQTLLAQGEMGDVEGNLGAIRRMADRIARITEQLRGFARKATGEVAPVPLDQAIRTAALLTENRREAQRVRLDLPELDPALRVMAETVRLEQILVNLLQNAEEALRQTPDGRIAISVALDGPVARITVTDNGPGLDPAIAAQLFTPFATSKPRGLGLGLVISQEIARDFGGSLHAAPPVPGRGASFILELPRCA